MYAYKRLHTTYYDWMEAVNRVDVPRASFHRPLIIRSTVRQILRFMHDGYIDGEHWTSFRDYLVKKDIGVSRMFDGIFLHECLNHQRFLMALSYIQYLQQEEIALTPTGLAMYLYLARHIDIRPDLTEYRLKEENLLKAYEEFLSHKIAPDSTMALPIIAGLTLTAQWKEALKYLPILDNDLDGMQQALGFVLTAAAKFHDYTFFFSLLDNISQTEVTHLRNERDRIRVNSPTSEQLKRPTLDQQVRRPVAPSRIKESDYYVLAKTSQAYETFTNYLTGDHREQIQVIKKLLDKTATNAYIPPKTFVQALETKLHEYVWSSKIASLKMSSKLLVFISARLDPNLYKCDYIHFYPKWEQFLSTATYLPFFFLSSGQSVDGQSTLPSVEPTMDECQTLHSSIRTQFQSLLESHCPKVCTLFFRRAEPTDGFYRSSPKIQLDCWIIFPIHSMFSSIACTIRP